jgi:hypothetical protein
MESMKALFNGKYHGRKFWVNLEEYLETQERPVEKTGDIDSFMYTSDDVPILGDINLIEFPDMHSCLTKNYIPFIPTTESIFEIQNCLGTSNLNHLYLHQLPNFKLGSFGENSLFQIHVVFPQLRRFTKNRWVNIVKEEQIKTFYNNIVIPSLREAVPKEYNQHYSLTYEQAMAKARNMNGSFSFLSKALSKKYHKRFFALVKEKSINDSAIKGVLFHLHAKAMKLLTKQVVENSPADLLRRKYTILDWDNMQLENLFIDFGVEYFSSGTKETLIWNMEFVKHIFQHRLKTRKPNLHHWCQFANSGGANSHQLTQNSDFDNLLYVQMYMNEKEIFYTFGKRSVFDFSPYDIMVNNSSKIKPCLTYFLKTLNAAKSRDTNYSARIEYRIPFSELRTDYERYYNLLDHEQSRMYILPNELVFLLKQHIALVLEEFGRRVSSLRDCDTKMILGTYIHNYYNSLIRLPDPFKQKYIQKIFTDQIHMADELQRFTTIYINIEQCKIDRNLQPLFKAISMLQKSNRISWKGARNTYRPSRRIIQTVTMINNVALVPSIPEANQYEEFSLSATPLEVLRKCLDNIFEKLPLIGDSMQSFESKESLTKQLLADTPGISDTIHLALNRKPWEERMVDYFPTNEQELLALRKRTGSRLFQYYEHFLDWWNEQEESARSEFKQLFSNMNVLPSTEPKKAYIRKGKIYLVYKQ